MSAYARNFNLDRLNGWDLVVTMKLMTRLTQEDIIPHLQRLHWGGLSVMLADERMLGYKFVRQSTAKSNSVKSKSK